MTLRKLMLEARQNLLKEERKLEKQISSAPPGSLIYSKNTVNNKIFYKWYVSGRTKEGKRTKIYIPQKNRNYARALAKKRLRVKRLRDVKAQIRAVDAFLAKYRENSDLDASYPVSLRCQAGYRQSCILSRLYDPPPSDRRILLLGTCRHA